MEISIKTWDCVNQSLAFYVLSFSESEAVQGTGSTCTRVAGVANLV